MRWSTRAIVAFAVLLALAATPTASAGSSSPHGPDVASYQHPHNAAIDWQRVRSGGASFAFVKATEGSSYTNPYFSRDYAGARSAGLVRSAYHFARPHPDVQTARDQAAYFVKVAGTAGRKGDLPLTLDLEESGGLSPSQLAAWTQEFLTAVTNATHRTVVLYTYPYFWQHDMGNTSKFANYPLWIASYRSGGPKTPLPGGWKSWTFWQYTSSGAERGISGPVDESLFSGSQQQLNALADPTSSSGSNSPLLPPLPISIPPQLPNLPTHPTAPTLHRDLP
jgi:GH25 family lysozyme M1 (1,4-beta-N-acetylmuramidase)